MFKIALPLIFILGSILGFVFFVNPQYKIAKENDAKLEKVNDALKKAAELRQYRDKLMIERGKISNVDLDRITKMVPDGVENIGLIIEMNNIARNKGMELLNPTIGASVGVNANQAGNQGSQGLQSQDPALQTGLDTGPDGGTYGSLSMTFSVNTTYEKFIDFLQELERSLRLVDVTDIKFSAPDPETNRTNFDVTLKTYWLR